MAELTDRQSQLLFRLEQGPIPRNDVPAAVASAVIDLLAAGLARLTVTNIVISDDGRRALTALDGRTRVTVQRWGRQAMQPPDHQADKDVDPPGEGGAGEVGRQDTQPPAAGDGPPSPAPNTPTDQELSGGPADA